MPGRMAPHKRARARLTDGRGRQPSGYYRRDCSYRRGYQAGAKVKAGGLRWSRFFGFLCPFARIFPCSFGKILLLSQPPWLGEIMFGGWTYGRFGNRARQRNQFRKRP